MHSLRCRIAHAHTGIPARNGWAGPRARVPPTTLGRAGGLTRAQPFNRPSVGLPPSPAAQTGGQFRQFLPAAEATERVRIEVPLPCRSVLRAVVTHGSARARS